MLANDNKDCLNVWFFNIFFKPETELVVVWLRWSLHPLLVYRVYRPHDLYESDSKPLWSGLSNSQCFYIGCTVLWIKNCFLFFLVHILDMFYRAHQTRQSGRLLRLGFNEIAQFLSKSEVLVALSIFSSPYFFHQ
jgi:hypothetical protein